MGSLRYLPSNDKEDLPSIAMHWKDLDSISSQSLSLAISQLCESYGNASESLRLRLILMDVYALPTTLLALQRADFLRAFQNLVQVLTYKTSKSFYDLCSS